MPRLRLLLRVFLHLCPWAFYERIVSEERVAQTVTIRTFLCMCSLSCCVSAPGRQPFPEVATSQVVYKVVQLSPVSPCPDRNMTLCVVCYILCAIIGRATSTWSLFNGSSSSSIAFHCCCVIYWVGGGHQIPKHGCVPSGETVLQRFLNSVGYMHVKHFCYVS